MTRSRGLNAVSVGTSPTLGQVWKVILKEITALQGPDPYPLVVCSVRRAKLTQSAKSKRKNSKLLQGF